MTDSLAELMRGLIDYAGLFPPAQLPMDRAAAEYRILQNDPRSAMLGRFVCPAARLAELPEHQAGWPVVALGRGGGSAKEFFDNVRLDLLDIERFQNQSQGQVQGYDVRLPASALTPPKPHQLSALVGTTAYLIETAGLRLHPFFELPKFKPDTMRSLVQTLLGDRATSEAGQRRFCQHIGWKVRCGGDAIPSVRDLAWSLAASCAGRIPWKATAGLHHALPTGGQHGFLNVFTSGVLAFAGQIDENEIETLLLDANAGHFVFGPEHLDWTGRTATLTQIREARKQFVTAFGSCSFEEPVGELTSF